MKKQAVLPALAIYSARTLYFYCRRGYNDYMKNITQELKDSLQGVILGMQKDNLCPLFDIPEIKIEYPANEKFGDYATNIPMILAKKCGKNPVEMAESIKIGLDKILKPSFGIEKIEVAPPGYINFYLSKKYLQDKVAEIQEKKENFGNSAIGKGLKVNNEFISANPTGPLTVGNGRGGFCGDVLSNILRKAGFETVSEYYVNDAGGQVIKLGHSVLKDSEAVYAGDYIEELNKKYSQVKDVVEVGQLAAKDILENTIQKLVAEKMRISFDVWTSEKQLHKDGYVERAIEILKNKNLTYEKEGALWLKTTGFGDDKDRVLIKSDGQKAYFANDCGYMLNKIERGFDRLVMILGADHHGYVARLQALAQALGFSGRFDFIITQLVRVIKDGKEVRMSKRAGNVVYIDDLIDEVGQDVARFFFLMYSPDTHMNFDLGLAKERSEKNPVYYVQYAHARIASILRKAQNTGISNLQFPISNEILKLLTHEKELSLMKELNKFPELVEEIAESYAVHKLPQYAIKLADKFHSFYNDCRVIDEGNPELSGARQELINAVKIVLAEVLGLIGVNAPDRM